MQFYFYLNVCNYLAWLFDGAVVWVGDALSLHTLAVISASGSSSFVLISSNSVTK